MALTLSALCLLTFSFLAPLVTAQNPGSVDKKEPKHDCKQFKDYRHPRWDCETFMCEAHWPSESGHYSNPNLLLPGDPGYVGPTPPRSIRDADDNTNTTTTTTTEFILPSYPAEFWDEISKYVVHNYTDPDELAPSLHHQEPNTNTNTTSHLSKRAKKRVTQKMIDQGPKCCIPTWECYNFFKVDLDEFDFYHKIRTPILLEDWKKMICCLQRYWIPTQYCPYANCLRRDLLRWLEPPKCSPEDWPRSRNMWEVKKPKCYQLW
jgi:hypothetical protein